jgi:hypothetical protein
MLVIVGLTLSQGRLDAMCLHLEMLWMLPLIRVAPVSTVESNLNVCHPMRKRFWDNGLASVITLLFTLYLSHTT